MKYTDKCRLDLATSLPAPRLLESRPKIRNPVSRLARRLTTDLVKCT